MEALGSPGNYVTSLFPPLQLEHLAALRLELRLDALGLPLGLLVQRLDAVLQHLVRGRGRGQGVGGEG